MGFLLGRRGGRAACNGSDASPGTELAAGLAEFLQRNLASQPFFVARSASRLFLSGSETGGVTWLVAFWFAQPFLLAAGLFSLPLSLA